MPEKAKKNKILYIITKSVWAGAGKYVYDLATGLPRDKFEIFVAAGGKDAVAKKIIEAGIPYFEIKNFQRDISIFKEMLAYFEILWLLLKIRPDIIHVNSSKAGGVVGIASWDYRFLTFNFKIKSIFTAHGWAFHESRPKWQIWLIRLLTKITCLYYSRIICVSEYDCLSAIKNRIAPAKKLITIHNGIKIDEYKFLSKTESRKKFNLSDSNFVIGTIGEFTKNKGYIYLIETIKNLQFSISNFQCVIIGFGEEYDNLKFKIKNLKLEDKIFLVKNLSDAYKYLKAFDIFILPSLKEGLPYVLLEADLAEVPIIATKVGGIPEIIQNEKTGLLINPANPDELADAIRNLINNPDLRKKLSINANQKIFQEFSFEKMLKRTLAAYENKASCGNNADS